MQAVVRSLPHPGLAAAPTARHQGAWPSAAGGWFSRPPAAGAAATRVTPAAAKLQLHRQRQRLRHTAACSSEKEREGSEEQGRGETARERFRQPGSGGEEPTTMAHIDEPPEGETLVLREDEVQRTAGEPMPGGGVGFGHETELAAAAPPPPREPSPTSQGGELLMSEGVANALMEQLGQITQRLSRMVTQDALEHVLDQRLSGMVTMDALDQRLSGMVTQDALGHALDQRLSGMVTQDALDQRLSGMVTQDALDQSLTPVHKQLAALARATGANAESLARASFGFDSLAGYWPGCQVTDVHGLLAIASCDRYPANEDAVLDAVLKGHCGFFALRQMVLRALEAQEPQMRSLASQFGQGSGAAWWQAEGLRWGEVQALLLEQPNGAGEGARWWRAFVSTLQEYCTKAATASDAPPSGSAGLRNFLLKQRRDACAPVVMLVAVLAAGQLRTSLDFYGEPRLAVQDGVAAVEVMEAKASKKGLSKARQQLQLAGKVMVWLLHVANPKLLEATQPNQLQVRGVIAVQGPLPAEERQDWEQDVEVGCPGLDATMRLDVWMY